MIFSELPLVRHTRFEDAYKYIDKCRETRLSKSNKLGFVLGEPGVGKSRLIAMVKEKSPSTRCKIADKVPVMTLKAPTRFTESAFYTEILISMGIRQKARVKTSELKIRVRELLKQHRVELMVLDEIQDAIPLTGVKDRTQVVKALKFIVDDTDTAIVVVGTLAARPLAFEEEQIASRSRPPFTLQEFQYTTNQDRVYWRRFIKRILLELNFPIPETQDLSDRLMLATGGDLRALERLMIDVQTENLVQQASTTEEALLLFKTVWIRNFYGDPSQTSPFELSKRNLRSVLRQTFALER
ncbi:MAG: TniB family NTP-binding protein [Pseudomonadota bacterium]